MQLINLYKTLLKHYGKQKWWPLSHDFKPKEWEICVGAILTQNTNWRNVEKALLNLNNANCISPRDILGVEENKLQNLIKSSGFFKQKSERLKVFSSFILKFKTFENFTKNIKREDLLKIKGIGPETADSILLYVCNRSSFVIDSYTKRLCNKLNLNLKEKANYEDYKSFFEKNLPKDIDLYKEFHALIVQWGKDQFKEIAS